MICHLICRMQKMAVEYNERIENVNRERKFHQVISIDLFIWKFES
jgi:hypothetical protein